MQCVTTESELRAALDCGGDVHVAGTTPIILSRAVEITRPITLNGGHLIATAGPAVVISSSDVTLDRVRITGGGLDTYDSAQRLIRVDGTQNTPLERICLSGCRISDSRGSAIWMTWCRDSLVTDCVIHRVRYAGVMVISGRRITVSHCSVVDAPLVDPVVNTYGIAVTDMDNTTAARSRDCAIIGNTVHAVDWEGIDTHGGDGVTVADNTVTACPRGIALVVGNDTRVTAPQRCTVSGNTVDGRDARRPLREGVGLFGIPYTPAGATITGNTITGYTTPFRTNYIDRGATYIGGNNVPLVDWTPITLDGDYHANSTYPPQYRIDGNTVWLRGAVIPNSSTQRTVIGRIPNAHAWPSTLSFIGYTQGSNPNAGNGMVAVDTDGEIRLWYRTGTDFYSYFLSGSYQAR